MFSRAAYLIAFCIHGPLIVINNCCLLRHIAHMMGRYCETGIHVLKGIAMNLKALRFVVLVLATLTVGMKFAHVLELTPKLQLPPETYIAVQTQLYQLFGSIGPIIDIAMVIGAIILAFHVYGQKAFPYTVLGVA